MPRIDQIEKFLKSNQMEVKNLIPIKNDASFRQYFRIDNKILMDADPDLGEDVNAFIHINYLLHDFQLNVPKIYSKDKENGFLLLEDIGKNIFSRILDNKNEEELYKKAIEVLAEVYKKNLNEFSQTSLLENYSIEKLLEESQLFIEWYLKKFLNLNIIQTEINDFTGGLGAIVAIVRRQNLLDRLLPDLRDTLVHQG